MTPLQHYLELESKRGDGEDESVLEQMDEVWLSLDDEDRAILDAREPE